MNDLFALPVQDKYLIYSPLHGFAALVDRRAAHLLRAAVAGEAVNLPAALQHVYAQLSAVPATAPMARSGPLVQPFFLGLIPTRGCNLGCRYCDFPLPKNNSPVMDLALARQAIEAYFQLLVEAGQRKAEVHFFGGEPFFADKVVHFAVAFAELRAAELGLWVRFEVTTNGLYPPSRCQWIADHFDAVVLSLDGPPDIQDEQRPAINGRCASSIVTGSARILSQGSAELILRACVTQKTVSRLPEIASYFANEFRPSTVCFENLTPSGLSQQAGLQPPDPWEFARNFIQARRILAKAGVETVTSTADLGSLRASFCPVGKDALVVSPDGAVDACYLLQEEWRRAGLDMNLGRMVNGSLEINAQSLERVRAMTVFQRRLCACCSCRYHCAGGCHVNHDTNAQPGQYDYLCTGTRLLTAARLLENMGQQDLVDAWMQDRPALEALAFLPDDRLCAEGRLL